MLKTAVFDCAIGGKCCSVDGRRCLPSFFRPHPGGFDSSRVPTPWNLPSKAKVVGGGGAGCSWNIFLWILDMAQEVHFDIATNSKRISLHKDFVTSGRGKIIGQDEGKCRPCILVKECGFYVKGPIIKLCVYSNMLSELLLFGTLFAMVYRLWAFFPNKSQPLTLRTTWPPSL